MFLMIQNVGIAAVEAFTVLGLSTARGDAGKIGQFGTGSKHSVNLLLRNNLAPIIYLGNEQLTFGTQPAKMGDKEYSRVYYNFRGEQHPTAFALEFGELDWDSVEMALREFVSNAIDQSGTTHAVIQMVDTPVGYPDKTTVYIPANDQVKNYLANLSNYFLHFRDLQDVNVIVKAGPSKARIYRMGVFVREIDHISMYDYNFGPDVKIDESRNMDDDICRRAAAETLAANRPHLVEYLKSMSEERSQVWEDRFSSWSMNNSAIREAWNEAYGKAAVCSSQDEYNLIRKNGHEGIVIKHNKEFFTYTPVPKAENLKNEAEKRGVMECKPSPTMKRTFKKVWEKLQNKGLTKNKPMPTLIGFNKPTDADGESLLGFYDPEKKAVYINCEHEAQYSVHLEEIAHYVTGASDGTRAFQDYAFQVAAHFAFR